MYRFVWPFSTISFSIAATFASASDIWLVNALIFDLVVESLYRIHSANAAWMATLRFVNGNGTYH